MSYLLRRMLLLMILTGGAVMPVKACGYDNCCQSISKLLTAYSELTSDIAKDLKELKANMNRSLASMAAISSQLERHSADLLSHDDRLKAHDASQTDLYKLVQSTHGNQSTCRPTDCTDIRKGGSSVSGVYRVYIGREDERLEVDVYCDFGSEGQSWLVFQRRKDGSVDFYRNWSDYANGFGNLTEEFWLGNEKLSLFTTSKKYKLRIEMEDFYGFTRYAEYSTFSVKPSTDKYRLTVAEYSGNARDGLTHHNNRAFSTMDADNDNFGWNCALLYHGGWWFNSCIESNLNGRYPDNSTTLAHLGIHWYDNYYSLRATEMKITIV